MHVTVLLFSTTNLGAPDAEKRVIGFGGNESSDEATDEEYKKFFATSSSTLLMVCKSLTQMKLQNAKYA